MLIKLPTDISSVVLFTKTNKKCFTKIHISIKSYILMVVSSVVFPLIFIRKEPIIYLFLLNVW